jgi:hypothetical protein
MMAHGEIWTMAITLPSSALQLKRRVFPALALRQAESVNFL